MKKAADRWAKWTEVSAHKQRSTRSMGGLFFGLMAEFSFAIWKFGPLFLAKYIFFGLLIFGLMLYNRLKG